MSLVACANLSMHYGGPLLLDGVNLAVEPGDRIGIIGRNGTGKSTLLKLFAGLLEPTEGSVTRQRGMTLRYQAQELEIAPGRTVYEEMRSAFQAQADREARLRDLERLISDTSDPDLQRRTLGEYERLQQAQEQDGVYDVDHRIEQMLSSLGIGQAQWHQPVAQFSGGERNVLGLARILLAEPDVLLLDEPSNHLDMDGVEWFIDFTRRTKAAVVMVSHNRHMLDATANSIWELRRARVTCWTGGYSDFQRQKAEAVALQERQFKVQQRLIKRIEFQARRMKDMANAYDDPGQAKRAKAMLKRLERMDVIERPDVHQKRFGATLNTGSRHGRIALSVKNFSFAYGERVLFDKANVEIEYGERVCLVGANGSGKTTLFREIRAHGGWENETLRLGKSVQVGEYRQFHDALDPRATLEDWTCDTLGVDRPTAQALLHRFLFTREDLERVVATLSGGEKSRLQLARLVHEQVNFLLLDEPTNHLDIEACEQLEEMLQEFEGTLLLISHDRYFLDKLVDRVLELENQGLTDHRMSFATWWQARHALGRRSRRGALEDRQERASEKDAKRTAHAERQAEKRAKNRLESRHRTLEAQIGEREAALKAAQGQMEAAYGPDGSPESAAQLLDRAARLKRELQGLYDEWESVSTEMER